MRQQCTDRYQMGQVLGFDILVLWHWMIYPLFRFFRVVTVWGMRGRGTHRYQIGLVLPWVWHLCLCYWMIYPLFSFFQGKPSFRVWEGGVPTATRWVGYSLGFDTLDGTHSFQHQLNSVRWTLHRLNYSNILQGRDREKRTVLNTTSTTTRHHARLYACARTLSHLHTTHVSGTATAA